MTSANQPVPATKSGTYLVDVRTLVVVGVTGLLAAVLVGFYLWMVRPSAAREAQAACAGLLPQKINKALNPELGTLPVVAPDFTVTTHDGRQVQLSHFRGKVVLLNLWASWCGVCKTEKPSLYAITNELAADDVVVLTLASDTDWARVLVSLSCAHNPATVPERFCGDVKTAKPTMEEALAIYSRALPNGTPYQVMLDPPQGDENVGAIATAWGVKAVPESFVIDRLGRVRYYFDNKRDWNMSVAKTCLQSIVDE